MPLDGSTRCKTEGGDAIGGRRGLQFKDEDQLGAALMFLFIIKEWSPGKLLLCAKRWVAVSLEGWQRGVQNGLLVSHKNNEDPWQPLSWFCKSCSMTRECFLGLYHFFFFISFIFFWHWNLVFVVGFLFVCLFCFFSPQRAKGTVMFFLREN